MNFFKKEAKHFIYFLSKWTDLDVEYYLRSGAWVFFTQFVVIFCFFILSVAFARLGSKELLGEFQFVTAFLATLSVLALPGVYTAVFLAAAKGKDGAVMQGVWLKIKWSLLGCVILIATAFYAY